MRWRSVPVSNVASIQLGKMLSPKAREGDEPRPYLRNTNVQWGRIDLTDMLVMNFDARERMKFELRAGDVLVCEGGEPGRCAVVERDLDEVYFQKALIRVRPDHHRMDPRYFARVMCFLAARSAFALGGNQATIAHFPAERLAALEVPLPPIEEQRRIAGVLDKADAIRRKRREALALTDELLRATFLEMFGDPVANPRGWPVEAIGPHLEIVPGWSANGSPRPAERHERGVLKVSAVTGGVYRPEENKVVEENELTDRELVVPVRGDLLLSRANTRDLVAAVCLVGDAPSNVFLPDKLWRVRPASGRVRNEYLRYLLSHPRVHDLIASTASGTSGSMLNVSQEKVRSMRLPLPPKDLQDRFARVVWDADAMRRRQLEGVETSEALFAALQHRAFRGEL